MLYHLVSNNPDDYGTIRFSSSIHKHLKNIRYRISHVSFDANFLMTTDKDYITIETNDHQTFTHTFSNHGQYTPYQLLQELNKEGIVPLGQTGLAFSYDNIGFMKITHGKDFVITSASHSVKLLMGLYNTKLPVYSKNNEYISDSIPMFDYGNVLYLTSRTGQVCGINNENDKEETRSIAYKINEIVYPKFCVICKIPGTWSTLHSSQLSDLTFQLVDFQLHPVHLCSPLFVTLEVSDMDIFQTDLVLIE